jgi:hypothetical protein
MKSVRLIYTALTLSALVLALAGCGKSSALVSPAGNSLDTTPPAAPTAVAGSYDPAAQRDYLNWDGSTSPDVAGYEVWQYESDPSLGGTGVLIGSAGASAESYALPLTNEARPVWFRVRATDEAGNLSAFSSSAQTDLHAWEGASGGHDGRGREGVN